MASPTYNLREKFKFVDPQIAKEPYIFDILNEISRYQENALKNEENKLATIDDLYTSRNIKIPFNTTRKKNILYIIDTLTKNYPEIIKTIISFNFHIDAPTKKLTIDEKLEYTVELNGSQYERLFKSRNEKSVESLLNLLIKFRLFNMTKLINKSKYKKYLNDLIQDLIGVKIFVYNNYTIDKENREITEKYCFHLQNYNSVRNKLNVNLLKKIIAAHKEQINRRLKNYGILNSDFTDYRESKLDYLLNIILKEIPASLNKKELSEVKNFSSLRKCLIEMDKVIDPIIPISSDIKKCIEESGICKESDLYSIFDNLTRESLEKWINENIERSKIFSYTDGTSETIYIDGKIFLPKLAELHNIIYKDPDKFESLNVFQRQEYMSLLDMLCSVGKSLLKSETNKLHILDNEDNINTLKTIIEEHDRSKNRTKQAGSEEVEEIPVKEYPQKKSILRHIIDFIKSLFSRKKYYEESRRKTSKTASAKSSTGFSRETKDIYTKIRLMKDPLIPLSDFIEIIPENEVKIDRIIAELRGNNLKIVIPIYNARSVLYPKRSRKVLISDVEYLLVEPTVVNDPDTIREFTDSLAGFKFKDDTITPSAIVSIEKYLLTLYRQKRKKIIR